MRCILCFAVLVLATGRALGADAAAGVEVSRASFATVIDSTEVDYSVVALEIPRLPNDRVLVEAYLEFNLDVDSALPDSLSGGTATLELALMPTLEGGRFNQSELGAVIKRTVKIGSDRTVRVYVTSIVRDALEQLEGGRNQAALSLLVGPITGHRYGRFEAQPVPGAHGNAKTILTVRTRERYDPEGQQ